ncbi:hypothetical protein UB48_24030 [Pseudomonas sp. 2(2015)]|nr:hypothetical protein UB48_24030 [Pseudomonas sp. 2(2015)]
MMWVMAGPPQTLIAIHQFFAATHQFKPARLVVHPTEFHMSGLLGPFRVGAKSYHGCTGHQ